MSGVKIGRFMIANYGMPFVVAEAGINHNGELAKAFRMIWVAKKAGADAIKFQTFKAEEFVADPRQMFTYRSQGRKVTESMLKMFKRYEFSVGQWKALKRECDAAGIMFLSTPQNPSDLGVLLGLGVKAIKVGSDDFTNIPLLKTYAKTGLPIILSCGMSDMAEVRQSLDAVGAMRGCPTILLVCTSQYPTPLCDANLLRIRTLAKAFPRILIGYSDHTQGPLASSLAVALGACFLEKHFTLDHDLPGPDHWFSADQQGLAVWVKAIRDSFSMLGDGIVKPTKTERANKREFQRIVVALKDISGGEAFCDENIGMRRIPGGRGLLPNRFESLIGKRARRVYAKGSPIGA
ncbi:MAG: N-acetylneuraminate synthase family protein [Elusimicrobia bacterium]|nr:N-acetylneuraminate synthase family protein [Elusimicrobiota bacterium]